MPRTHSLAWSELKIGILSVVAIALAAMLIFMVSGEGGFFWQRYAVKTTFKDIAGLKEGAPVRVAGVEVGSVTMLAFNGDSVEVTMEVGKEQRPRITDRSVASLGSVSLLGEAAVDLTAAVSGTGVPDWGYVKSGPAPGSIASVAEQATASLEQTSRMLKDVGSGKGTLGKLVTDDALYKELNSLLSSVETLTNGINKGKGTLGRLATNQATAKSLEASLQNLEAMTARIRNGEGSLGKLMTDDAFAKSLSDTTANLSAITGKLNRGEGTAGKLMTDNELYNRLNSMTDRIDKLTTTLQTSLQGDGTAGQLLHDKQLYENLNGAVGEMRNLLQEIKRDPKKYLNVKVSLF